MLPLFTSLLAHPLKPCDVATAQAIVEHSPTLFLNFKFFTLYVCTHDKDD